MRPDLRLPNRDWLSRRAQMLCAKSAEWRWEKYDGNPGHLNGITSADIDGVHQLTRELAPRDVDAWQV